MNLRRLIRPAAVLSAAALVSGLLMGLAPAANAAGSGWVMAKPCLTMRSSATSSSSSLVCVPYKTTLSISCTTKGQSVTGPYGASTLWDKVSYGGKTGYVADAWMYTGSSGAVAGSCSGSSTPSSSLSSKVDAFVAKWKGRLADFDGYYGGQCVDLFNYYSRDVIGARFAAVGYAYQLYDTYDSSKYTRLSASTTPRKGDVAIWSSSFPGSGGAGHVAIVLSSSGSSISTLTQNPGVVQVKTFTKSHLRGYLRPR